MSRSQALVLGLGRFGGGRGAAEFLLRQGYAVTVTDLRSADDLEPHASELTARGARLVLGEHRVEDFHDVDLVVVNPALPASSPWITAARAAGARCTTEIELFLERCPARVVAVTGTQGKSSTCHLTAQLLEACGQRVHLGGNIGGSLLGALDTMRPSDAVVLELSSYQLEHLAAPAGVRARGCVQAAAVTNVLADHLERHGSLEAYAAAKQRLLALVAEGGRVLLPTSGPPSRWPAPNGTQRISVELSQAPASAPPESGSVPGRARGLRIEGDHFLLDGEPLASTRDLRLVGDFQRDNALIALGLARCLDAAPGALAAGLAGARGMPHRLERLGRLEACTVFDNGVSTTPDSTESALRSTPGPVVLLCGGRAKDLPLDALARQVRERAQLVVAFGESAPELAAAFAGARVHVEPELERAVAHALAHRDGAASLLFSPACASFDGFLNFEERALAFRRALPPLQP